MLQPGNEGEQGWMTIGEMEYLFGTEHIRVGPLRQKEQQRRRERERRET